jgi:hypothetical protein
VRKNDQYDGSNKTFGTEVLFLVCNHEILQIEGQYFMVAGQK